MVIRIAFGVVLLGIAGCADNNVPANNIPQRMDDTGYVPPADRGGYIDATDPDAFPPTPEQPAFTE